MGRLAESQLSHQSHAIHHTFVALTAASHTWCCSVPPQWEHDHGCPGQGSAPRVCGGGGPCMGRTRALHICLLLSTWPLRGTLALLCANFCFETPFFCRSGARADLHLHRNLCEQQVLTFIMEVPADKKKGVLLLCFCVT